jgi:hypothetical protein|eukprot:gene5689-6112_t
MPNYENGRIYRIHCNVTGEDYISSTTLPLSQRLAQHKQEYKQYMRGTNAQYSLLHKVMEANDFQMTLLERYPCDSKEELHARVRYWEAKVKEEEEEN